jgi:hypothetical protein
MQTIVWFFTVSSYKGKNKLLIFPQRSPIPANNFASVKKENLIESIGGVAKNSGVADIANHFLGGVTDTAYQYVCRHYNYI